ncbi:MAG: nucleotidyl transferase AbiEii/AbiGii toxin family protein [Bacilli bacterium]
MICWDCIDQKTGRLLKRFKNTSLVKEFYLSGGTALALQLGHRVSIDLDFFSQRPSSKIEPQKIIAALKKYFPQSEMPISYRSVDQVWLEIDGIKVTFLAYPFARKHPFVDADGIPLAGVRDIALQKAFSVGRRAAARDYVDLAWILRSGATTFEEINRDAYEVFVENDEHLFSPRLFMQQIVYTEDLEDKDVVVRQLQGAYDFDDTMEELRSTATGEARHIFTSVSDALNHSVANRSRERTCSVRCQTSKAPASACRCICRGKNHGSKSTE